MYICICRAVTESEVRRCVREGACTLSDLQMREILKCDLDVERRARPMYQQAIAYCESVQDYVSRELLEDILESEEEHIDWLETNLDLQKR
jgi:bacterioferritin